MHRHRTGAAARADAGFVTCPNILCRVTSSTPVVRKSIPSPDTNKLRQSHHGYSVSR